MLVRPRNFNKRVKQIYSLKTRDLNCSSDVNLVATRNPMRNEKRRQNCSRKWKGTSHFRNNGMERWRGSGMDWTSSDRIYWRVLLKTILELCVAHNMKRFLYSLTTIIFLRGTAFLGLVVAVHNARRTGHVGSCVAVFMWETSKLSSRWRTHYSAAVFTG